jgi:hypothetical protein
MHVQAPVPAFVPKSLAQELRAESKHIDNIPGLIVSAQDLSKQNLNFARAIQGLVPPSMAPQTPAIVISPRETSNLFKHSDELALLKAVAGLIAEQVHPYVKTGIDAVWLVYKAAQLQEEWSQPGRNTMACGFKMAGLVLNSTILAGSIYPDIKLPDSWSNGFNFIVKSGESIVQGKTLPVNELVFSTEKRLDIPLKVLKCAGIALDPPTLPQQSILITFARPTISPLIANK